MMHHYWFGLEEEVEGREVAVYVVVAVVVVNYYRPFHHLVPFSPIDFQAILLLLPMMMMWSMMAVEVGVVRRRRMPMLLVGMSPIQVIIQSD